jgi:hypothetical protein
VPLASGSRSKPNTHNETANVMANQEEEQVEGGTRNSSKNRAPMKVQMM